jgi:hypothetical protein
LRIGAQCGILPKEAGESEGRAMCVTCGCDEYESDHGDPRHITMAQIIDAAEAAEIMPEEAAQNIVKALKD